MEFTLFNRLPADLRKIQFPRYLSIKDFIRWTSISVEYYRLRHTSKIWSFYLERDYRINSNNNSFILYLIIYRYTINSDRLILSPDFTFFGGIPPILLRLINSINFKNLNTSVFPGHRIIIDLQLDLTFILKLEVTLRFNHLLLTYYNVNNTVDLEIESSYWITHQDEIQLLIQKLINWTSTDYVGDWWTQQSAEIIKDYLKLPNLFSVEHFDDGRYQYESGFGYNILYLYIYLI